MCCGSVAGLLLILRALMAHRMTVFSVFLAVPNAALRTLANKSTVIGDEEEESDDGAPHALSCATLPGALKQSWGGVLLRFHCT